MAFTMMATAGAAYTDQADIEATEAVEMLNAIGVMTGDPDGSFRPNDTITRAEACRMIYTIRTNSDNADAYANMQTTFKDVPSDAWYAGYVKHCQAANIVSGTSATTFEPNRDVTGVELALMCLRVMGYDPEKADIGGSTWSTKTIGLATEAGLLDGVNTPITSACPRQWAAQIMYNTIDARTVRWSNDSETYTDLDMGGNKMERVGKKYMKLYVNIGTLATVKGDDLTITMTKSDEADSDTLQQSFTKVGADYSSLLGNKVKVLFRDGKANDVIGVYATEDNNSYTVNMKDVDQDDEKVKFDGKSYSFDDSKLEVQTLDVDGTVKTESVSSSFFKADDNALKADVVTFVDNDGDGKLNIAFITKQDYKEVTYVGSDRITAGKTYKMEDENIADDIAKDDWAVISYNRFDECKDIVKAEVVTDTLNSSKTKTGYKQYEIGSTWYNISNDEANNVSVGDTVKAYIVSGVIVKIDTDDGTGAIPTNIAVVVGKGTGTLEGDQVKLRFFDGTTKTVTLDDKGDIKSADKATLGEAYKVSGTDSNTRLDNLTLGNKYNGYYYNTTTTGKTENALTKTVKAKEIGGQKVDDNAVVILYTDKGASKKITGKQFNALSQDTLTANNAAYGTAFTKDVNGLCRVLLASVKVNSTSISGTSYDNYGYIVSDGSEKANGDISFTMWNGSENVDVLWENGEADKLVKGTLVAYSSVDDNKYVQDGEVIGTLEQIKDNKAPVKGEGFEAGSNKAESAKSISVGNNSLNVTADTHVLVLDTDADKNEDIGQPYTYGDKVATAAKKADGTYCYNVVFRAEDGNTKDDADLDLLVVDVTGAFNFDKPGKDESGDQGTIDNDIKDVTTVLSSDGKTLTVAFTVPAGTTDAKIDYEAKVGGIVAASGTQTLSGITGTQAKFDVTLNPAAPSKDDVTLSLKNLVYTGFSGDASAATINEALKQEGVAEVTVGGEVSGNIAVPEGKTLKLSDNTKVKDVTLSGKVAMQNATVEGNVDLSKADVAALTKVTVGKDAALNVTAGNIKDLSSGTLEVAAGGALKVADSATESSATLVGSKDARIVTAANTKVEFNLSSGAMTINGDAEIPAGQTWYSMLGPVAAEAKGLNMTVASGKLTVNGELKLVSGSNGTTFTVSGTGSVVVGKGGVINVAAKANVSGNNAITGTDATSKLNVTKGSASISGVAGVSDHTEGNYTWQSSTWSK